MPSSSVSEIRESIEARIAALRSEISSLESARSVLGTNGATATSAAAAEPTTPPPPAAPGTPAAPRTPAARRTPPASRTPPARRPSRSRKPRKAVEVLLAGKLETMLREAPDGLSVAAIATRSNARGTQVRSLLGELENAGQVRRAGAGRSSRWRYITDEERIAERAAELAKLSRPKG